MIAGRLLAVAMLSTLAGCGYVRTPRHYLPASNFPEWFPTTTIISDPPGARVEIDGAYQGSTPLSLVIPRAYRVGYRGLFRGGNRVVWIGPAQVVAVPEDPTLRAQRMLLPANVPAPPRLAFDMRGVAPSRIGPSEALLGEAHEE